MVNKDFNAQAANKSDAPSVSEKQSSSVNETAKAQIENTQNHEKAMDSHYQDWPIRRDKLAHSAAPTMSPVGNETPGRDIQRRLTEIRTQWEIERDGIDNRHSQIKQDARESGTTLTDCFSESKAPQTARVERDKDSGRSR